MARMHSGKRGNAGSKKPLRKTAPSWVRYKPKEIKTIVERLAKEGKNPSEIGLILRDTYGIPSTYRVIGERVSKVLKDKNLLAKTPEDLMALIKKAINVKKHLEENKHDMPALHGLQLTESKIKRLVKYYKRIGRLPEDWKYDPGKIRLYIE